jgi:DNA-binding transcriptional LysR family regulator
MGNTMRDLNDLYYFVQVVEHGGFAPAGRALGEPKSKLSRRIAQLEQSLGVRLLQRSTRHFSVTDIGLTYYRHCKAMLIEAEAADEAIAVTRAEPRGSVRLSCPHALLDARVGSMLSDFLLLCPAVHLQLEATNRQVDVVSEGLDFAIRVRPPPLADSELVMRVLADRGQCLVASPALLAQFGTPLLPADLVQLPSLALGLPQDRHTWELFGPGGASAIVQHQPRLVSRGMATLRTAAVAGVGMVQMPNLMVAELLQSGELVWVLPEWRPRREIVHAVYSSRRGQLPSVRALLDFLADCFARLDED